MSRTIQPLKFGDQVIYIEVSEVEQQGQDPSEQTRFKSVNALDDIQDAGTKVLSTVKALCATMQQALADSKPSEWTLEINMGFKGSAGVPFVTQGEANGAVKVTAKWVNR